jgi:hypothetical protein
MKIQLFFACVLAVNTSGFAHAQSSQNCDVQVIFDCKSKCESVPGSADLTLNFGQKVATFCRGEQCDDGDVNFFDEKGRLNGNPYRIFRVQGTGSHKFFVFGILDRNGNMFGSSDEIGNIAGTCK